MGGFPCCLLVDAFLFLNASGWLTFVSVSCFSQFMAVGCLRPVGGLSVASGWLTRLLLLHLL